MINFNGGRDLETPEFLIEQHRRARRPDVLQPLRRRLGARDGHAVPVDQAGRLALGRHPQRHDRPLAERHQGARARSAPSSTTSSTSRRPSSRPPGCPSRRSSTASRRSRSKASACSTPSTTPTAAERHETQYFEMFGNRGIYHKGWTAVTRHTTPWLRSATRSAALRRRRLGALRHHHDWTQAHDLAAEHAREAARAAAAVADRGDASTTCCRSTTAPPSAQPRARRPPAADQGQARSCCSAAWAG